MKLPDHIADATRLTRLGKLKEATLLLLRGAGALAPRRGDGFATPHEIPRNSARETAALLLDPAPHRRPQAPPDPPAGRPAPGRFERRRHAGREGARAYRLYVPATCEKGAPLIVMLHGCKQTPEDFATGTRMNAVADEMGFAVCYPEQSRAANVARCWNWFAGEHQRRDHGEPAILAAITRAAAAETGADLSRIFIAGLSAGGAAAAVMGTLYPDLYAAVGVHSGLACGAASDVASAFAAMKQGAPASARRIALGRVVPTIVFHGDRDETVAPVNAGQVIERARGGAELLATTIQGRATDGTGYTRTSHAAAGGAPILEHWVVHGGGHAWSGGDPHGSYATAAGPDASREMARFFLAQQPVRRT